MPGISREAHDKRAEEEDVEQSSHSVRLTERYVIRRYRALQEVSRMHSTQIRRRATLLNIALQQLYPGKFKYSQPGGWET